MACITSPARRSCASPGSATGRPTRRCCPTRQTLVRCAGAAPGRPTAAMLPPPPPPLPRRPPARLDALAAAMGADPVEAATALAERAGASRLRDLGVTEEALDECARAAAQ